MVITIRQIQKSDSAAFRAALDSVVSEKIYLLTQTTPPQANITKFVHNNVDNNYAQYVAMVDDKLVGWADIIPHSKEALKHTGLLGMGVIAEYRGKGIGKKLLEAVINHSWEIGLTRLELEVFANNLAAIALYKKFGFAHEGTKRNARYIQNSYEDAHIMAQCRL